MKVCPALLVGSLPLSVSTLGLSDDILHSVLKRGCHGLRELDLSASPRRLSDYALDLIGQ